MSHYPGKQFKYPLDMLFFPFYWLFYSLCKCKKVCWLASYCNETFCFVLRLENTRCVFLLYFEEVQKCILKMHFTCMGVKTIISFLAFFMFMECFWPLLYKLLMSKKMSLKCQFNFQTLSRDVIFGFISICLP